MGSVFYPQENKQICTVSIEEAGKEGGDELALSTSPRKAWSRVPAPTPACLLGSQHPQLPAFWGPPAHEPRLHGGSPAPHWPWHGVITLKAAVSSPGSRPRSLPLWGEVVWQCKKTVCALCSFAVTDKVTGMLWWLRKTSWQVLINNNNK